MYKNYLSQLLGTVIVFSYFQLPANARQLPTNAESNRTQTENLSHPEEINHTQTENPLVREIDRTTAQQKATDIFLAEGKITSLKFEDNNNSIQKISMVALGDSSRNTYFISRENDGGEQGKIVFVRQIKPIEFPGATTTQVPNLIVVTVDQQGNENEFVFNINNDHPEKFTEKIVIKEPKSEPRISDQPKTTILTKYGESSPSDIQLGLNTLIKSGKISRNNSLIPQINEYYALTTSGISSKAALKQLNIPLSVLQKLAEIGQEEDTKQRLTGIPQK